MYCPSIRASDVEITVDDETLLLVHANPYFLRLNFPRAVVEDDESSAQYDPSSGSLTVTLTKQRKGENFEDLDLLGKLLAPRRIARNVTPSIEVISSDKNHEVDELASKTGVLSLDDDDDDEITQAAKQDWQLPQTLPEPLSPLRTSLQVHYGFLDLHSGYLKYATHTENEINELGDEAEVCTGDVRRSKRVKHEEEKFDEEHYIADFMDDGDIKDLLQWTHPYTSDTESMQLTEKENLQIMSLPKKEYLATPLETHNLYLTLVTFLFSYAYESRISQNEPTSESAWTICNLIPAFSALDPPRSELYCEGPHIFLPEELRDTLLPSYRRSLVFPLYRSFALAEKCREDAALLLQKGKRIVMRCLLEMKDILDHEVYYIYSKIWVDDFCLWIQADADDEILRALGTSLLACKIDKASIGWGLSELETMALELVDRPSDSDDED